MAIVAEGERGRVYIAPTQEQETTANKARPGWTPDVEFFQQALGFRVGNYGMTMWSDLFTARQLVALETFSDLVEEARERVMGDALAAGLPDDGKPLGDQGTGPIAYSQAVSVYLGCALSRLTSYNNTICHWNMIGGSVGQIFARQAIPMSWDYIEVNPLEKMSGNWAGGVEWVGDVLSEFVSVKTTGHAQQLDARKQEGSVGKIISTDPPYYDNVGYADLSDFFYVWLRPSLRAVFPDLFATLTVPKAEELVATPDRHGGKEKAGAFFLNGMTQAMHRLAEQAHPAFPVTIYYAFKQAESDSEAGTASTGWETFLDAVIRAGLALTGTWPMRTESQGRPRGLSPAPSRRASSSYAAHGWRMRPPPHAGSFSTRSRRSFLWLSPIFSMATSLPWTWRKRPSVQAWQSIRAMPRCSMPRANRSRCGRRSHLSTRLSTKHLPSKKGISTPTAVGR